MNVRKPKFECPLCGYHLCARKNNEITCLRPTCEWAIPAKRREDNKIPTVIELKNNEA